MKRFNKKRILTNGAKVPGLPFMGELMECTVCHQKKMSDPKKTSNWTMVQVDEQKFYYCPICWTVKIRAVSSK